VDGLIVAEWWLGDITVRTLDLQSNDHVFDSPLGHYHVVTTKMCDCLRTSKPTRRSTQSSIPSW